MRVQRVLLFSSSPLIAELADVLSRRRLEKKIAASLLSSSQLVDLYAAWAISVQPLPTPGLVSDPDDDVVIGTALAAKADLIVTGDKALLLVAKYDGGRIVSVAEALRHLTSD